VVKDHQPQCQEEGEMVVAHPPSAGATRARAEPAAAGHGDSEWAPRQEGCARKALRSM